MIFVLGSLIAHSCNGFSKSDKVDSVKTFSKSSSERFGQWVNEENLRVIYQKFTALLAITVADQTESQTPSILFCLPKSMIFNDIYFEKIRIIQPQTDGMSAHKWVEN